ERELMPRFPVPCPFWNAVDVVGLYPPAQLFVRHHSVSHDQVALSGRRTADRPRDGPRVAARTPPARAGEPVRADNSRRPISSTARSAMPSTVAFSGALGIVGITDASTTRNPAIP